MKAFIVAGSMVLSGISAFAQSQHIQLSAGGQIQVSAGQSMTIQCAGEQASQKPSCELKATSGYYIVNIGNERLAALNNLESATKAVKNLREAGICQ